MPYSTCDSFFVFVTSFIALCVGRSKAPVGTVYQIHAPLKPKYAQVCMYIPLISDTVHCSLNLDNARQLHKSQLCITQSKTVLNMDQTTYRLSYKLKYYSSQKSQKLSNSCSLSMFSLPCGLVVWFTGP